MILASNNAHKLDEFRAIFADMGIEIIPQSAAGCDFEVDETGETFEENAYLKAIAVTRATGQAAIADDSGLEVDALGGAPGVHSARYTGRHDDTDAARNDLLLHNLGDRTDRTARFVSCICCTFPNGDVLRARGTCEGSILFAPRGENGFGYDPLFLPEGYDCSMAELRPEEKNAISHRGNALKILKEELRNTMLTSKQRAQLRGLAATEDTIVHIGKGGITDNIVTQMNDALKARELVKGRVLENSLLTAREACDRLAATCRAEPVQVIGSKFVLYKRNEQKPKIELVKKAKK